MKQIIFFCLFFWSSFSYGFQVSFGNLSATFKNSQKYSDVAIAEYERVKGNVEESFKFFNRLGDSDWADKGILYLLEQQERYDLIVKYEDKFKDDVKLRLIIFRAFVKLNKMEKAEQVLLELVEKKPDDLSRDYFSVVYYYSVFLIDQERFGEAIRVIDKFLVSRQVLPIHSLLVFLKAKIHFDLGKLDDAEYTADKALKLDDSFDKAWLLKAMIAEKRKDTNKAIECYNSLLATGTKDQGIQHRLITLLFSQKRFKEAEEVFLLIPDDSAEYFFDLALAQWKSDGHKKALQSIDRSIEKDPTSDSTWMLKIEVLFSLKKNISIVNTLKKWLSYDSENKEPLKYFTLLKTKGLSVELILEVLNSVLDQDIAKNSKNILSYVGDLYLERNDFNTALKNYQKVLKLTKDGMLRSTILYQIAFVYLKKGETGKVEAVLLKAISCDEVYSSAYNLLATLYLEMNKKMDYAEGLIDKALTVEPNNVAYLDTKACLLSANGRKKKAKVFFKKALQLAPGNSAIQEHYKLCE